MLKSISLFVFLLLAASFFPGCAQFNQQFNAARNTPKDAANPLPGAYEGQWTSRTGHLLYFPPITSSKARLVIDHAPDSDALELWLALSDFDGIGATRYFSPANLKMNSNANPPSQFTAKIAAGYALVFLVNGRLDGDDLSLRYKVVDVGDEEVQHEQGTITLHRVAPISH